MEMLFTGDAFVSLFKGGRDTPFITKSTSSSSWNQQNQNRAKGHQHLLLWPSSSSLFPYLDMKSLNMYFEFLCVRILIVAEEALKNKPVFVWAVEFVLKVLWIQANSLNKVKILEKSQTFICVNGKKSLVWLFTPKIWFESRLQKSGTCIIK